MRRGRVLAAAVVAASLSLGLTTASAGAQPAPKPEPKVAAGSAQLNAARIAMKTVLDAPRTGRVSAAAATGVSASAVSSATVSDPTDDNNDGYDLRGDITQARAVYGSSLSVGLTVAQFDDPETSYNWMALALGDPSFIYGTGIIWGLDVNSDQNPDYDVVILNDGVEVVAGVTVHNEVNFLCGGTPGWSASSRSYSVKFARSCIGSPAKVRAQGFMVYETPFDISIDITGWTHSVTKPGTTTAAAPKVGYWMLGADGHVYPFGGAVGFPGLVAHATAMAPRKDGKGYWVVDRAGHVFSYGAAKFYGGAPALAPGEFVSTISATPSGGGYWLFTNRGRAFPFGNASSYGDMSGAHLNGPIVASVATPSGHGYYMVGSDGGIFSFGDARFHGSTGNLHLNKPVVGISPTSDGKGYWLVASDGGVFAFNAPFRGSMGGTHLNKAVDGLVAFGNGYLMAASDGGIFNFSNKPFLGSLGGTPLAAPIIGLAAFSS